MTPKQGARSVSRRADRLQQEILRAEAATLQEAERQAVKLSSGTHSSSDLAKAGYPFATRAPNSEYNPEIINKQTGLFQRSWRRFGPCRTPDGAVSRLINIDPVSKFLFGTRKMVPRPVWLAVAAAIKRQRLDRLRLAVRRSWKG